MPYYKLVCPECGKEEEVICPVNERNAITCECGGRMKVKITTANFVSRGLNLRVNKWVKERGL
jgi:putative FmdB family regulatory protein